MSVKFGLCKQIGFGHVLGWASGKSMDKLQDSKLIAIFIIVYADLRTRPDSSLYSGEFKKKHLTEWSRCFSSDKMKTEATTMKYKEAYRLSKGKVVFLVVEPPILQICSSHWIICPRIGV